MPSQTALIGALDPLDADDLAGYESAFNSLEQAETDYAAVPRFGARPVIFKNFYSLANGLQLLGFDVEKHMRVLNAVKLASTVSMATYTIYGALAAKTRARVFSESAKAAAETAALIPRPWAWWKIIAAMMALAWVSAAFAVGQKFGSGDWKLQLGDLKNPLDRLNMQRNFRYVTMPELPGV